MEQAAAPEPSSAASNFAGFLASLAVPHEASSPAWKDDELADDVATLSYEQALRRHGRYHAADAGPKAHSPSHAQTGSGARSGEGHVAHTSAQSHPGRKGASITIRLTEAECPQVRARAAEAGLTVSAYLRSCALEVESLRTQVKETVANLRSAKTRPPELEKTQRTTAARKASHWLRLWPFSRRSVAAA